MELFEGLPELYDHCQEPFGGFFDHQGRFRLGGFEASTLMEPLFRAPPEPKVPPFMNPLSTSSIPEPPHMFQVPTSPVRSVLSPPVTSQSGLPSLPGPSSPVPPSPGPSPAFCLPDTFLYWSKRKKKVVKLPRFIKRSCLSRSVSPDEEVESAEDSEDMLPVRKKRKKN